MVMKPQEMNPMKMQNGRLITCAQCGLRASNESLGAGPVIGDVVMSLTQSFVADLKWARLGRKLHCRGKLRYLYLLAMVAERLVSYHCSSWIVAATCVCERDREKEVRATHDPVGSS
ncbi:hypothetical protein Ancab_002009 [Ancistrocladus abbreviatus]